MNAPQRTARIVEIEVLPNGYRRTRLLVGDTLYTIDISGSGAQPGEIYQLASGDELRLLDKIGAPVPGHWDASGDGLRWRTPDGRGRTRFKALHQRHVVRRAIRDYLDSQGFIQCDMPLLVRGSTPDTAVEAFDVEERKLVTSCEYQLKRLAVGGFERVYSLTQNFRQTETRSRWHNPEFTMLEWARVGTGIAAIEADAEQLVLQGHQALDGNGKIDLAGRRVDLSPPWDRITVREALEAYAGVTLNEFSANALKAATEAIGLGVSPKWQQDRRFLFSVLMSHIQPRLGNDRPVFVRDWPAFETSSVHDAPGGFAERSELVIAGVEISDGFPTLTCYQHQSEAFASQNEQRRHNGAPIVQIDRCFMDGLAQGLPAGAGMALGFDRLVAVLAGCDGIAEVLAFGWNEL